jgi:hypothetical protein
VNPPSGVQISPAATQQFSVPLGNAHVPLQQTFPAAHTTPHDPQWARLVLGLTQVPQNCIPRGQSHVPLWQKPPPEQGVLSRTGWHVPFLHFLPCLVLRHRPCLQVWHSSQAGRHFPPA